MLVDPGKSSNCCHRNASPFAWFKGSGILLDLDMTFHKSYHMENSRGISNRVREHGTGYWCSR